MANTKLQNYFDYYKEKHPYIYDKGWLDSLTEWITYAQEIKKAVLTIDFSDLDETQRTNKLDEILQKNSNDKIKNTDDFFQEFLFIRHNKLGSIDP